MLVTTLTGEYCQNEHEDEESSDQVEKNVDQMEERSEEEIQEPEAVESIAKNRSRREIRKPARFDDMVAFSLHVVKGIPNNYRNIVEGSESSK